MTRFVLLHYICDIKWLKTIFKLLTNCQKLQFLNEQIRKRKTPYLGFYNHSVAWVRSKISNSINYFENPAKRSWNLILDIKWRMIWDWIHLKWSYQIQGRMARRFMLKVLRGMSVIPCGVTFSAIRWIIKADGCDSIRLLSRACWLGSYSWQGLRHCGSAHFMQP